VRRRRDIKRLRFAAVGQFDEETALRRHLAIPLCGIAATASN